MKILSAILIGLYAVLNLFLAVAGMMREMHTSVAVRAIPCALFLVAGGMLAWGAIRGASGWVIVGVILASIAPVVYGALVEHSNVLLHHAIRAVVASGFLVAWAVAHPAAD